ncbi:MAG: hypothetical protein COA50_08355 [Flavobacteriaceae bacterium]|nr:hypothetical protein [Sneathiella sp.]PCJ95624.1 MAG: hypothetical protein COA50_08355 [Flavobacteriaceae bacterium]
MKKLITILALALNTLVFAQSGCSDLLQKGEVYGESDSNPKTWCEIAAAVNTPYTKCMCEEENRQEVEQNERNRREAERKAVFDRNREKKKQIDKLTKEAREYSQSENYDEGLALLHQAKSIAETYEEEPKIEMRGYRQYSKSEKISWIQDSIDSMQRAKDNSGDSLSLKLSSSTDSNTEDNTNSITSNNSSPYLNTNTPYSNSSQSKRTPNKEESLFEKNQRLIQQNSENFKRQQALYEDLTPVIVSTVGITINLINTLSANRKAKKERERERERKEKLRVASQKRVQVEVSNFSKKLKLKYNELVKLSTFYTFNEKTLKSLEEKEKVLELYETTTVKERLLFWRCHSFNGIPTEEQFQNLINEINEEEELNGQSYLLKQIEIITNNQTNSKNFPHTLNYNEAFAGTLDQISIAKAKCFRSMGLNNKAKDLLANLYYNVDINSAITIIQELYLDNEYYLATQYYQQIENYFLDHPEIILAYNEFNQQDFEIKGHSYRYDVNYILGLGIISYIKSNQLKQAQKSFSFLKNYQNNFDAFYQDYKLIKARKKIGLITDIDLKIQLDKAESIVCAVKATLLQKQGNYSEATKLIDNAISLDNSSPHFSDSQHKYLLWFQFIKADLLVKMKQYDEAKIILKEMKNSASFPTSYGSNQNSKGLNLEDYSFLKIVIRYKTKDYNGALLGLKILKSKKVERAKYYEMEAKIYRILNDIEKAGNAEKKYEQLKTIRNE